MKKLDAAVTVIFLFVMLLQVNYWVDKYDNPFFFLIFAWLFWAYLKGAQK